MIIFSFCVACLETFWLRLVLSNFRTCVTVSWVKERKDTQGAAVESERRVSLPVFHLLQKYGLLCPYFTFHKLWASMSLTERYRVLLKVQQWAAVRTFHESKIAPSHKCWPSNNTETIHGNSAFRASTPPTILSSPLLGHQTLFSGKEKQEDQARRSFLSYLLDTKCDNNVRTVVLAMNSYRCSTWRTLPFSSLIHSLKSTSAYPSIILCYRNHSCGFFGHSSKGDTHQIRFYNLHL